MTYLTLFHNGAVLPLTESEPLRIWKVDETIRIVVSAGVLTTAP